MGKKTDKAPKAPIAKKPKEEKKPRGRPSQFTKALADEICDRLASGETLRRICRDDKFPDERTVRRWVIDDVGGFSPQYRRARDIGLDAVADEMIDIADDGENDYVERERKDGSTFIALDREAVMRSALRVDTRKWYLSKLAPKRYDKPQEEKGESEGALEPEYVLKPDEDTPNAPIL